MVPAAPEAVFPVQAVEMSVVAQAAEMRMQGPAKPAEPASPVEMQAARRVQAAEMSVVAQAAEMSLLQEVLLAE